MVQFSRSQVVHLAQLAHLELSEAEIESFQKELSVIVDFVDQLQQVDVAKIEPTEQVTGLTSIMRSDVEQADLLLNQQALERNAAVWQQQQFKVRKIKAE